MSQTETANSTAAPKLDNIVADSWSRVAASATISVAAPVGDGGNEKSIAALTRAGRGSVSGWTSCPLCGKFSRKRYAIGRGISRHLQDVHTPWKPGKLAQKIHRRKHEASEREKKRRRIQCEDNNYNEVPSFKPLTAWIPTDEDKKKWSSKMLEVLQEVEAQNIASLLAAAAPTGGAPR